MDTERHPNCKRRLVLEQLEPREFLAASPAPIEPIEIAHVEPPAVIYTPPQQFHLAAPTDAMESAPGVSLDKALAYLRKHAANFGLSVHDLDDFRVTDMYTSGHTGVTHVYLQQMHNELDVFHARINVNLLSDGHVLSAGSSFLPNLSAATSSLLPVSPTVSAVQALSSLMHQIGWPSDSADQAIDSRQAYQARASQSRRLTVLSASHLSLEPIPAQLFYVPQPDGQVELAWQLEVQTPDGQHWYDAGVSATTGEILYLSDRGHHASYHVYPLPLSDPDDGSRAVVTDAHDPTASPLGWHDTNLSPGVGEFTDTRGNNAVVQEDTDGNDTGGFRPDGGAGLNFDFPIDLSADPSTYQGASVTNAFYWTNLLHDLHFQYGFDEVAGNFQTTNFSGNGLGGDAVVVDVQDSAELNNARFFSTPDGTAPRMEFFNWLAPPVVDIHIPAGLAGTYAASPAVFGPTLDGTEVSGQIVISSPVDGCSPLTNAAAINGNIALIERGTCFFVDKVNQAQDAGAIGVVVTNNVSDGTVTMGGEDSGIVLASVMLSLEDGNLIRDAIAGGDTVQVDLVGSGLRDSALDNSIIIHEYGHGVSNRLTGGPSSATSLVSEQSGGMGEGWSDWWALMLTQTANDTQMGTKSVGAFVSGHVAGGAGIRRFPYSFDLAVNPLTYDDIDDAQADVPCSSSGCAEVHDSGEIWASVLWDLNWLLINGDGANIIGQGFDADLYRGNGGNNLALQLVMDGLKLQPSNPTFLDGRDAILQADVALTGGVNHLAIWTAFARRGMGFSAADGGNANSTSITEAFDMPTDILRDAQWNGDQAAGNVGDGLTWSDPNNWTVDTNTDTLPSNTAPGDNVTLQVAPAIGDIHLGIDRTINALTIDADYVLRGGTLNIATGQITVGSGVMTTIDADLNAAGAVIKQGGGTLSITGTVPRVVVDAGTFVVGSTATVGTLTVESGATLVLNGAISHELINNGLLILGGDLNGDGARDADDIDSLYEQMSNSNARVDPRFDLVADQRLDARDVHELITNVLFRKMGDADLDGDVDIKDANTIVQNFNPLGSNSVSPWRRGNFDGDDDIDIFDWNLMVANFSPLGYAVLSSSSRPNDLTDDFMRDVHSTDDVPGQLPASQCFQPMQEPCDRIVNDAERSVIHEGYRERVDAHFSNLDHREEALGTLQQQVWKGLN
ncbi:MAG: M36 family metallopeptidase [Pirellulaceae bacterium]|nr:M36 family metallopeptidase [Pirellulaceae bacterium]